MNSGVSLSSRDRSRSDKTDGVYASDSKGLVSVSVYSATGGTYALGLKLVVSSFAIGEDGPHFLLTFSVELLFEDASSSYELSVSV